MNQQPNNPPALVIDGIIIPVRIDPEHEYTLTTNEVAAGYGVSKDTLKKTVRRHIDEMKEGKHWFSEVGTNCPHPGLNEYGFRLWTKRGIVRLGFFIRSERAKRFRDLAEDLVIREWEQPAPLALDTSALVNAINGLTAELRLTRESSHNLKNLPAEITALTIRTKAPAEPEQATIAAEGVAILTKGHDKAFDVPFHTMANVFARLGLGNLKPRDFPSLMRETHGSRAFQSAAGKAIKKHVAGFTFPAHGRLWTVKHRSPARGSVYRFTPVLAE